MTAEQQHNNSSCSWRMLDNAGGEDNTGMSQPSMRLWAAGSDGRHCPASHACSAADPHLPSPAVLAAPQMDLVAGGLEVPRFHYL
jgi:hypothetical protein